MHLTTSVQDYVTSPFHIYIHRWVRTVQLLQPFKQLVRIFNVRGCHAHFQNRLGLGRDRNKRNAIL
jgi:hypothetical protein